MDQDYVEEVIESGERLPLAMFEAGLVAGDALPDAVVFDGEKVVVSDEE
jgi:hypothetical protein